MGFCTEQDVRSIVMQYLIRTYVFLVRRPVSDSGHLHVRTQE